MARGRSGARVTDQDKKPASGPTTVPARDERRALDEVARAHVLAVVDACKGNRTNAARILGVDRKTLARKLLKWGISDATERGAVQPGSLIVIEGLDGAGITTQARRLVDYLNARGRSALLTGEPSTGPVGDLIRRLLAGEPALGKAGAVRALSLLFAADRVDHLHRVVAPALARGAIVVSDRWYHSSLAYQRTGVDRDWIVTLNLHTRVPDITVFLDVRPETGQQRRASAGRNQEFFHALEIQREVVAGYRATIAELAAEGERIEVIDGEQPEDVVFASIVRAAGIERSPAAGPRAKPVISDKAKRR
jgi:dTMP kinase